MASLWVLLLCILHSVICGTGDEYLIDLNVALISTQDKEDAFVTRLQDEFQITFIQAFHIDSTRMLHISGSETNAALVNDLPEVNIIEENHEMTPDFDPPFSPFCTELAAPKTWGLDRIDQRSKLASENPENILATYVQSPYRGAGVAAYIIDTGIDRHHPAFENRVYWGHAVPGLGGHGDGHGHGTHVAGTVGAQLYGVAREVILIAVKVFNNEGGGGSAATVLGGLKWVLDDHKSKRHIFKPRSVANLSLGGPATSCVDKVVKQLINAGIVVVAAAGNGFTDACTRSPARVKEAITVGASDVTDTTVYFSNWGSCVDLYAPGKTVWSTLPISKGSTGIQSGTSMAAPHVTGVVALKFSRDADMKTPKQMASWIIERSTKDKLVFYDSYHATSPNRLLYVDCFLPDV